MGKTLRRVSVVAVLALLSRFTGAQPAPGPQPTITRVVLYAEESVRLGAGCRADGGDVGVRTAVARARGDSQLTLGTDAACRDVLTP